VSTETNTSETAIVTAGDEDSGLRLDRLLAKALAGLSRVRVQALIRDGQVTLGGRTIGDANIRVKPGETFAVAVPLPVADKVEGEAMALTVVYEDGDVIVIDKPAGLVVHPAAGHATGTLVNALIAHCGQSLSGIGGVKRPGIVHRLDKDTSGLLVVAKNDAAHHHLSEQFKSHGLDGRLHRSYLALVWGQMPLPNGTMDFPLARSLANRTKIGVSRRAGGRHAVTHYEVQRVLPGARDTGTVSLVRLQLETGRTHQIRVHLSHIGHPVLGDPVYGTGFKTRIAGPSAPKPAGAACRRTWL
jgi:23S rRNA pseudouridine1911/1915/1917 synthase